MYRFVDLTDEQKHDRRLLLDFHGQLAGLSLIVPLLMVQIYHAVNWIQETRRSRNLDTPSSPVRKHAKVESQATHSISTSIRKAVWWAGDHVEVFGWDLGTKGEIVVGSIWLGWLLLLSILQTGDDYMHLTKRFGIVGASQLPFHYLLAVKTPYSPLQFVTGASHETLNSVHQVLGRLVTILFYLHTAFYLNFFIQLGVLADKLTHPIIQLGLAAAVCFTLIGTSSLAPVRKWSYRIFLAVHIALSMVVLPILFFHVSHIRIYVYMTLAILLLNIIVRGLAGKTYTNASLSLVTNTNLVQIVVPTTRATAEKWLPGQHAYISLPGQSIRSVIAKNPFTLSSVPTLDNQLRFVARIQAGNTAALAAAASRGKSAQHILIEGPYGVTTHADTLLAYDKVLLIAGGIGSTFIIPIHRQLLSDLSPSKGSLRRQKVSAVWITPTAADIQWALPSDHTERAGFTERMSVFVTQSGEGEKPESSVQIFDQSRLDETDGEGIEMEERTNLLSETFKDHRSSSELRQWNGRPNIAQLVDQAFAGHDTAARVAVVVCGPRSLGQEVRKEVGRWVYRGRTVFFWNESFAL